MSSERGADLASRPDLTVIGSRSRTAQRETCDYIAELVQEFADIARASDLPVLAYLLDVAGLEAKTKAGELADESPEHHGLTEAST